MHKLKIKFSPYDEDSKQELMASGCKPLLDLSLKASKSWDSVVEHLEKKWAGVKQLRLRIRVFYQTAAGQTGLNMCAAAQLSKSIFESVQNHPTYTPLDPAAASVEVPVFAYLYSLRPMAAIEALSSAASSKSKAKAKAKPPSAKAKVKAADSASTAVAAPPSTSRKQKGRAAQLTLTSTTTTTADSAAAASFSMCATPSLLQQQQQQQLVSQPQTNGCSQQHSEDSLAPLWLLAEAESSHLLGPLVPQNQNQTQTQTQHRHSARLAPAATVDGSVVSGDFGGNFFGACSLLAPPPLTAGIAGAGAGTRARSGSFGGGGGGGGHGLELSLLLPPPVPTARRAGTRSVRRDPALEPMAMAHAPMPAAAQAQALAQTQAQMQAPSSTVATRSSLQSQPQPQPQPQSLFGYIIQEGAPQAQTKSAPTPAEERGSAAATATPTSGLKRKTSPVTAAAKENNKLGGGSNATAAAAAAADSTHILSGTATKKLATAAPGSATVNVPRPSPAAPAPATIPVPTPVSASAAAAFAASASGAGSQRAQPASANNRPPRPLAPPLTKAPDFSCVRLPRRGPKRHLRRITPTFLSPLPLPLPLPLPMMAGPGQV